MLQDELQYMYGLQRFGVKPGLEVMERLMEALGHPEQKFRSIHIAGTNGKGSTASFLSSILQAAGYNVGLYTSPHLVVFNERIRLNGVDITDKHLARLVQQVRQAAETQGIEATFFEFTTAVAFLYFAERAVDIAVIEVGMGGRLDATNVIIPLLSVITTIGLDHTEVLGDTLLKIAFEKGGIIKPNISVVVGESRSEVVAYLRELAASSHSPLVVAQEIVQVKDIDATLARQMFTAEGSIDGTFEVHLLGRHQIDNAVTALAAIVQLRQVGWNISDEALKRGLVEARWDGRMQVVVQKPLIIVDGAHNEDGVEALYQFIKDRPTHSVLVMAQKQGKQLSLLREKIVPMFERVIVTEGTYEPMAADILARELTTSRLPAEPIPKVSEAIARAQELLPEDGFLLVTGSLYMVGGALEALEGNFP